MITPQKFGGAAPKPIWDWVVAITATVGGFGQVGIRNPFAGTSKRIKVEINILKMKKEQKMEQQPNTDSTTDNSQVSPTCPKNDCYAMFIRGKMSSL